MKKFASFVVFAVALFMFAFTLGLGIGENSYRFVDAVYGYTYGIWIPAAVLTLAMPMLAHAVYSDKREKAQKFVRWCRGLGSAEENAIPVYIEAIIIALDTNVISHIDVETILHGAAPRQECKDELRRKMAELIQYRLKTGIWNLKEADANRRQLIEAFAYRLS